jgi:hypothetical protein
MDRMVWRRKPDISAEGVSISCAVMGKDAIGNAE